MKKNLAAIALIALTAVTVNAADKGGGGSEYFYQSAAGTSDVTGRIGYESDSVTNSTAGSLAVKTTGINPIGIGYEYGINEMFSVGLNLGFISETIDNGGITSPATSTVSGLADPTIYGHGSADVGFGAFKYGLDIDLGLQKGSADNTTGNQSTASDGATSFTPYIGLESAMGPGVLGAKLAYRIQGDKTLTANSFDTKYKGANETQIAVFYEMMGSGILWGADLHDNMFSAIKYNDGTAGAADANLVDAYSVLGIDVYARIPVANFQLIPRITDDFSSSGGYSSYNAMNISVAGRWTF